MALDCAQGQSLANCNNVYNNPQVLPVYKSGTKDLLYYFKDEITPIIIDYQRKDNINFQDSSCELTIDYNGYVIEVRFPHSTLPKAFIDELREKIKTMEGWQPGQMNGEKVCSKRILPMQTKLK